MDEWDAMGRGDADWKSERCVGEGGGDAEGRQVGVRRLIVLS